MNRWPCVVVSKAAHYTDAPDSSILRHLCLTPVLLGWYCFCLVLVSLDRSSSYLGRGTSVEKMPPFRLPVGKAEQARTRESVSIITPRFMLQFLPAGSCPSCIPASLMPLRGGLLAGSVR